MGQDTCVLKLSTYAPRVDFALFIFIDGMDLKNNLTVIDLEAKDLE